MAGKQEYKQKIKELINKAAFIEYSKEKSDKSKLNQLQYKKLQIQPYLAKSGLSNKEKKCFVSTPFKVPSRKKQLLKNA